MLYDKYAIVASTEKCECSASSAFSLGKLGLSHISLKKEQCSAILPVYLGQDVFVCLPTRYGKSMCYQCLPFLVDYKHKEDGTEWNVLRS